MISGQILGQDESGGMAYMCKPISVSIQWRRFWAKYVLETPQLS